MGAKFFDCTVLGSAENALDFIGKDPDGKVPLWNEGARRRYAHEPEKVIGNANSEIRLSHKVPRRDLITTRALITNDPLGFISDVNQRMEALTGRTREELIGPPFKVGRIPFFCGGERT